MEFLVESFSNVMVIKKERKKFFPLKNTKLSDAFAGSFLSANVFGLDLYRKDY